MLRAILMPIFVYLVNSKANFIIYPQIAILHFKTEPVILWLASFCLS